MRSTLMKSAAAAAAVVAVVGLTAAPAIAAGTVNVPFSMAYGASISTGTISFTAGYSATVTGAVHAVSTPKYVCGGGSNGSIETDNLCSGTAYPGGPNVGFSFPFRIAVSGGVQTVNIALTDADSQTIVASRECTRKGCIDNF
jgi:hypothetical protein